MSTGEFAAGYSRTPSLIPGLSLWLRQFLAIFRIEFGKALFSRRAIICYALAGLPVLIFAVAAFETNDYDEPVFETIENARQIYGYIFSALIVGAVVFLGSAAIFTTLFRGEILDRSIHYYLLTPVRREILVTAKYLAGLACAFVLFGLCTLICFLLLYVPFGMEQLVSDLTNGIATAQLGQYLGITLLASMGYGSVFMATGLLFRNPLIPIVLISGWEMLHFILPPALKIFSIIYYLKGLLPIPLDEGPLAVIVAPPPVWVSIFGMFGLCVLTVMCSVFLLKRLEVKYTDE
jgi:ABC-type transport system involved in multi-copper enzyme maturation permease subunit